LLLDVAALAALEAALLAFEEMDEATLLRAELIELCKLASELDPAALVAVREVLAAEAAEEREEPRDEASEEREDPTEEASLAREDARDEATDVALERAPLAPDVIVEPTPPMAEVAVLRALPTLEVMLSTMPWPETAEARARMAMFLNCILTGCWCVFVMLR